MRLKRAIASLPARSPRVRSPIDPNIRVQMLWNLEWAERPRPDCEADPALRTSPRYGPLIDDELLLVGQLLDLGRHLPQTHDLGQCLRG